MPFLSRLLHLPLSLFQSSVPVPAEHRANFRNLYGDIGWYGILNGSALSFLSIYLARLGASGTQIGFINAAPAITSLIFVLAIGRWLERKPIKMAVFISSVAQRLFYIPLIFLPMLLSSQAQIWTIIVIILIMSVPGTAMVVGFNTMFADLVPSSWRGYVVGVRNALLSIVSTVTTLICGWLLVTIRFPVGYQVVFGLGLVGAFMSSVSLYLIARPSGSARSIENDSTLVQDNAKSAIQTQAGVRTSPGIRTEILRGSFGKLLILLFFFHLVQYLAIPVFPLFSVNYLKFSDQIIGIQSATFSIAVFLGSSQLDRLFRRLGNHKLLGLGIIGMGFYPILTGLSRGIELYILAAFVGGLAWAMAGGVLYNYIYDKIPENERPLYLAWYTLVLNAAILIGSLGGPALAAILDLSMVLILFGLLRVVAGAAILIWG